MSKLFKMPLKTFDEKNLLQEMLDAKEGTVFVLGSKSIGQQIGDNRVELTFVQIQKVTDPPHNITQMADSYTTDKMNGVE